VSGMIGEKVNVSQIYVTRYIYFHWFSYEMVSETYIVIGDKKKHLSCKKFVCTKIYIYIYIYIYIKLIIDYYL
jgi:hypothetical protein